MVNFLLDRAKAIAALSAPPITVAIMAAGCKTFDIPFPDDARTWVITIVASIVSGAAVHQIPNRPS